MVCIIQLPHVNGVHGGDDKLYKGKDDIGILCQI